MGRILFSREVELMQDKYVVYLKEVPTQIEPGGNPLKKAVRAFIKKARAD